MLEYNMARPWIAAACALFGVDEAYLLRPNRKRAAVVARQALITVLLDDAGLWPSAVARLLERDHSTICYHAQMATDPHVQAVAASLRNQRALQDAEGQRRTRAAQTQARLGRIYGREMVS